jgi:hypothetical protein
MVHQTATAEVMSAIDMVATATKKNAKRIQKDRRVKQLATEAQAKKELQ